MLGRAEHEALSHGHSRKARGQEYSGRRQRDTRSAHLRNFVQSLIGIARRLYADESFGVDLNETVYALDTTIIDLCLSVFPWAPFMATKAAVKLGNIPAFIHITDGKVHEVNFLDELIPALWLLCRGSGFLGLPLHRFHQTGSFFVTRARSNIDYRRRYSHAAQPSTGVISDQTIVFTGFYAQRDFRSPLRRARFTDPGTSKTHVFIRAASQRDRPALPKPLAGRALLQMDQAALRIKRFFGTSENAVKSQIWIAVSVYVLVAIVKKRLN